MRDPYQRTAAALAHLYGLSLETLPALIERGLPRVEDDLFDPMAVLAQLGTA